MDRSMILRPPAFASILGVGDGRVGEVAVGVTAAQLVLSLWSFRCERSDAPLVLGVVLLFGRPLCWYLAAGVLGLMARRWIGGQRASGGDHRR